MRHTLNILPSMIAWAKAHEPQLNCADAAIPKKLRGPKNYIDCDDVDRRILTCLPRVSMGVGYPGKRFARDMEHAKRMTKPQRDYAYHLVYRFRRQLPDDLVAIVEQRLDAHPSSI